MERTRCPVCGEWIRQRDRVVRVIVEVASRERGDSSDPLRWSKVEDWCDAYCAHFDCCRAELEVQMARVDIPCAGVVCGLVEDDPDSDPPPGPDLTVVSGGHS